MALFRTSALLDSAVRSITLSGRDGAGCTGKSLAAVQRRKNGCTLSRPAYAARSRRAGTSLWISMHLTVIPLSRALRIRALYLTHRHSRREYGAVSGKRDRILVCFLFNVSVMTASGLLASFSRFAVTHRLINVILSACTCALGTYIYAMCFLLPVVWRCYKALSYPSNVITAGDSAPGTLESTASFQTIP